MYNYTSKKVLILIFQTNKTLHKKILIDVSKKKQIIVSLNLCINNPVYDNMHLTMSLVFNEYMILYIILVYIVNVNLIINQSKKKYFSDII